MEWWHAVVLGIVQGLTEFLPISSSAHLRIVSDLLGIGDTGAAFTAITQIGTEAAVILIYARRIGRIIRAWTLSLTGRVPRDDPDARMGWYVILGSIPVVVLGLVLQDAIDTVFRNLYLIALTLGLFALVLGWADMHARQTKELDEMTPRDAVIFGFAQSLALVPGVSRSGGTITAGLLMGYTRKAAADYSFLLAIPAVLGSGFYKLFTDGLTGESPVPMPLTLLATVVAFVVGYLVIRWFLAMIQTSSYAPFVVYRIVLAIVVIGLLLGGVLHPVSAAA